MIGHFAGCDHQISKGEHYFTIENPTVVQLGQTGVPFFSKFWPTEVINKYLVKRVTPCSIDVSYVCTVYIVEIEGLRYQIVHDKNQTDGKLMVTRRKDLSLQPILKRVLSETEHIQYENIWERTTGHIVFLLNMDEYEKAGLATSWIHDIIIAGIAMF